MESIVRFFILSAFSFLSICGCSSSSTKPTEFYLIHDYSAPALYDELSRRGDTSVTDSEGRNLIHEAVAYNPTAIRALVQLGVDVNHRDITGTTPLHMAAQEGNGLAIFMLIASGADLSMKTERRIHCKRRSDVIASGATAGEIAKVCSSIASSVFDGEAAARDKWLMTVEQNTAGAYRNYYENNHLSPYVLTAFDMERELKIEQKRVELESIALCKFGGWYVTAGNCTQSSQFEGTAERITGESFAGHFVAGLPNEGKFYIWKQQLYDGPFEHGRPHGKGVCFYSGDPEECHYYEGRRIDKTYKERMGLLVHNDSQSQNRSRDDEVDLFFDLYSDDPYTRASAQVKIFLDIFLNSATPRGD